MFIGPLAARCFAETFSTAEQRGRRDVGVLILQRSRCRSNKARRRRRLRERGGCQLPLFFGFLLWSLVYNGVLLLAMMRMFQVRWRVAE
jgi:hypothetical protein